MNILSIFQSFKFILYSFFGFFTSFPQKLSLYFIEMINTLSILWNQIKNKNILLYQITRFFIIFLLISFLLFIILQGERPGWISIKNYYIIFLIAIIPSVFLGFYHNFFHYYIEEKLKFYIDENIQTSTLEKIGITEESHSIDFINQYIAIKSIAITTIALSFSLYFSNFIKLIIDKGFIKVSYTSKSYSTEEYIKSKQNPFFNFVGILIGGIFFTIFYLIQANRTKQKKEIIHLQPIFSASVKK
jgi:4-amino-4-deoxy-L-arabinose transferase-like glycosyltransferase